MKSEVFSGQRFWTYFKYDLTQMWRNHMKAAIVIGLAGLIFYIVGVAFNATFNHVWQAPGFKGRFIVFILSAVVLQLYQARTYGYLTDRRKGAAWLMIPASAFEKWLSMIIITLIVIPVAFLGTYAAVDGILSLADPTYGKVLLTFASQGLKEMNEALQEANTEYNTTWNLKLFVLPLLVSHSFNYLYFLLCGITFKRHKILWAILLVFGFSIVWSTLATFLGINYSIEINDLAEAEVFARQSLKWTTAVCAVISLVFAYGIFYRIKTLKH